MSNDQCPKCDVNFNVNLKNPNSKMSKNQFQRSQFQGPAMVNCSVVHADGSLFYNFDQTCQGFSKQFFCAKVWGTGPFFRYIITLIEAIWLPWNDAVPSWFLFYSDSVPRGRPLSNRQLLSERRQLRLLQVHRRAGLQVMRSDLIQSPLVISCVRPKHKQIL